METLFELRHDLALTPVAGDWVAIGGEEIRRVRERRTSLTRPDPNGKDVQVLAANIDLIMIVLPIDRGFSAKSLERLSVMAWDSGADQVVVLTKADLAEDPGGEPDGGAGAGPGCRGAADELGRRARPGSAPRPAGPRHDRDDAGCVRRRQDVPAERARGT